MSDNFVPPGKDCAQPLPPDFKPPGYTSVCDIITATEGPLADCISRVDSKQYHQDCIYDMVLNEGKQESACDIISDYVEECQREEGCVKPWRTRRFCCEYKHLLMLNYTVKLGLSTGSNISLIEN